MSEVTSNHNSSQLNHFNQTAVGSDHSLRLGENSGLARSSQHSNAAAFNSEFPLVQSSKVSRLQSFEQADDPLRLSKLLSLFQKIMYPQQFKQILWLLSLLITLVAAGKAEARIQPQPIFPTNGDLMDNGCENRGDDIVWTFQWTQPSLGATQYHLVVLNPDGRTAVVDRSDLTSTTYTETSPGSYIAEQNRRGWSWAVRALINGTWSDWGPVSTVDVEPVNTDCR